METKDILFEEITQKNNKLLEELGTRLQENEWALCLGAGVSLSAGLPNWYGLLAKITAQLIPLEMYGTYVGDKSNKAYYDGLKKYCDKMTLNEDFLTKLEAAFKGENKDIFYNINVLEAAEYIRNFLGQSIVMSENRKDREPTKEEKRKIHWYMKHLIQKACEIEKTIDSNNKEIQSSTLGAVAGLMKTEEDSLIHNVITYNYDNLLEVYLRNISGCSPKEVNSIVKNDDVKDFGNNSGWNIYHVHGRIPVTEHEKEPMSEEIILTESDYYLQEQINYSWTNILQSYAFIRSNLIFVGFSGADYNFRRIMKYVKQDGMSTRKKYIFFLVDDIVEAVFKNTLKMEAVSEEALKMEEYIEKCIKEMNRPADSKYTFEKIFINYMIHAKTTYWKKYDMEVIWSSRKNLAGDLNRLHKKAV